MKNTILCSLFMLTAITPMRVYSSKDDTPSSSLANLIRRCIPSWVWLKKGYPEDQAPPSSTQHLLKQERRKCSRFNRVQEQFGS